VRKSISSRERRSPIFFDLDNILQENDDPISLRMQDMAMSSLPMAFDDAVDAPCYEKLTSSTKMMQSKMRVRLNNRLHPMKVVGGHGDKFSTTLPES